MCFTPCFIQKGPTTVQREFDIIVIGSGPAGCTLASRLSENPARRVALVEAGRDYGAAGEPAAILDTYSRAQGFPEFFWPGLTASLKHARDGSPLPPVPYMQARILGGGSCVMGMVAMRGLPEDFDGWEAAGAAGWGWKSVLPYYVKLERDLDFSGAEHGADGPIPILRQKRSNWPPLATAVAAALEARGHRSYDDINTEFHDGIFPVATSASPERRITAAAGYLNEAVRRRPNLAIHAETRAERLLFDGRKVTGVQAMSQDGPLTLTAPRVVVSAGGIHSPALLLRSGIGPAGHLIEMGVPVIADLPGVGAHLLNHPVLAVGLRLRPGARQGAALRPHIHNMLRYSSGVVGCDGSDMFLSVLNKTAWHAVGAGIGALSVAVYKSYSTGTVRLRSPDPGGYPAIDLAMLSDPRDLARMTAGLALMIEIIRDQGVGGLASSVFVPGAQKVAPVLSRESWSNAMLATALSAVMDVSPWVERRAIGVAGEDPRGLRDGDEMADFAHRKTMGMFHVAGTCKMGAATDRTAVVDPRCRVLGVEGVHVADASIMPSLPRGNTFLPVTMIGERAADLIGGSSLMSCS
jgi:5-(hydroxymethyl)furfural/furfural oxidase